MERFERTDYERIGSNRRFTFIPYHWHHFARCSGRAYRGYYPDEEKTLTGESVVKEKLTHIQRL